MCGYIVVILAKEQISGMATKVKGRVGKKGELFPPKKIRAEAGLQPGDLVTYSAQSGRIEVQRIHTLDEAFEQKKFVKISFKRFENMTSEVLGDSKI